MSMTKTHRRALDRALELLVDDLDLHPAITHLRSKELFTEETESKIYACSSDRKRVTEFVSYLKRSGDEAYMVFREYLFSRKPQKHIGVEIDKCLKEAENLSSNVLQGSGSFGSMASWRALEEKFYNIPCDYDTTEEYKDIPRELNILLIGKTGSGKSSTGNTLLGHAAFIEQGSSKSVTKTITMEKVIEGDIVITVIDTPGLFDTESDFKNEDLVLEIAKTLIDFRQGIHLFLLICNSSMRFTKEEDDTMKIIEKMLTKDVYKNCAIILSNAFSQFGLKDDTVGRYIATEKKANGKFSEIIRQVNDRVIAVENFFPDEFLRSQHRQKLLCVLMQLISNNKGSFYSNKLFKLANEKVETEEKERISRIKREQQLTKMRNDLGNFLLEKYLLSMSVKNLTSDCLPKVLEENVDEIMKASMVTLLDLVDKKDVIFFMKQFTNNKQKMIENILAMKLQEKAQENEIQKKNREIKQKEDYFKMQSYVLNQATSFLRNLSGEELRKIKEKRQLPALKVKEWKKYITDENLLIEEKMVDQFIDDTFFATKDEMEKFLNDRLLVENFTEQAKKMKELEIDYSNQKVYEKLSKEIPTLIESRPDSDLLILQKCLTQKDLRESEKMISNFSKKFSKGLDKDLKREEGDMRTLIVVYFLENTEFINSSITTALNMRATKKKMEEQKRLDEARTNALNEISEIIKSELNTFLRGKELEDLIAVEKEIKQNIVPEEILETVIEKLKARNHDVLDKKTVAIEILKQLEQQKHTIDSVKKESAKCFAACNLVLTKQKGMINISDVKVNDDVLAIDSCGTLIYDKVYLISHANRKDEVIYIKISTKSENVLFISPNHLLLINDLSNHVPATKVNVGDTLFTVKSDVIAQDVVTAVSYQTCKGAFCPMTMNGTIVVSGVVASCFTTFVNPGLAQALLFPFRVMFNYLPTSIFHTIIPYEPKEGMPVVLAKCRSVITITSFFTEYLKEKLGYI